MNIFRLEIGANVFFLIPRTTISALHHHSFAPHIHDLPAIPSLTPTQITHPFPRHGNITVSDDFFVAAILAPIFSAFSALAPRSGGCALQHYEYFG